NRLLLTASEELRVLEVLKEKCEEQNSEFYQVHTLSDGGNNNTDQYPGAVLQEISPEGQYFRYEGELYNLERIFIPLRGTYQVINAATAIAAVELLKREGFKVSEADLRSGLEKTEWPGRLELLSKNPYLIMDGAHNPAAIGHLVQSLPRYFMYRKLILVIGMMADKDIFAMLKQILPLADKVVFTRPVLPRAADPRKLASVATGQLEFKKEYYEISDHGTALEKALFLAGPEDAVLVTGSLYTVSDIRAYWQGSRAKKGSSINKVKLQ
ncbi:MAG: bifunctional folylpolyglutamate synthase/dihydrofolate synthase, partial [Bacillota bacterium]